MDFIEKMNASDFGGVLCAIIKMNSIVVTAGLFRVFGHEIVELPIVATGLPFKGNGYFKLFFTCFEKLLSFLKIKKLVVPSTEQAKTMWTHKFGFRKVTPMEQSEYRQKQTSMVAFNGTCLLEKNVPDGQITFEDTPFSVLVWVICSCAKLQTSKCFELVETDFAFLASRVRRELFIRVLDPDFLCYLFKNSRSLVWLVLMKILARTTK